MTVKFISHVKLDVCAHCAMRPTQLQRGIARNCHKQNVFSINYEWRKYVKDYNAHDQHVAPALLHYCAYYDNHTVAAVAFTQNCIRETRNGRHTRIRKSVSQLTAVAIVHRQHIFESHDRLCVVWFFFFLFLWFRHTLHRYSVSAVQVFGHPKNSEPKFQ